MANVKVEIKVATTASKDVYVVGSAKSLGAWDVSKAVQLEYCDQCGMYRLTKMLPEGQLVEFKVLSGKSWENVEKGWYDEEVENHILTPQKGLSVTLEVPRFCK